MTDNAKQKPRPGLLALAVSRGHVDIARDLLQSGADTDMKGNKGETAQNIAEGRQHTKMVELLNTHHARNASHAASAGSQALIAAHTPAYKIKRRAQP